MDRNGEGLYLLGKLKIGVIFWPGSTVLPIHGLRTL